VKKNLVKFVIGNWSIAARCLGLSGEKKELSELREKGQTTASLVNWENRKSDSCCTFQLEMVIGAIILRGVGGLI